MNRSFATLVLLVLTAPGIALRAQEEEPAATFFETVDVEVATVDVYVTDRQGNPVVDLSRDDFELRVDGRPVPITNFYAEVGGRPAMVDWDAAEETPPGATGAQIPPEQRLRIVVFLDQTNIRAGNRRRVLDRLREFLRHDVRREDAISVVSLTDRLHIHSDFLNDPATVSRIFDEIEKTSHRDSSEETERRRILSELARGHTGGGTSPFRQDPITGFSDAEANARMAESEIRAYAATEYHRTRASLNALERFLGSLAGVPGRKALLYVSDGVVNRPGEDLYIAWRNAYGASSENPNVPKFDPNSDYTSLVGNFDLTPEIQRASAAATGARVTLYALDAEGDHATVARSALLEGGAGTTEVLSTIEANVREPLEFISGSTGGRRIQASNRLATDLRTIATDFDSYYSLGFRLEGEQQRSSREIDVRLRADQRKGRIVRHRGAHQIKVPDERAGDAMLAAIFYNAVDNPLGLRLVPGEPTRREDGSVVLPVIVEIPVANTTLVPAEGTADAYLSIFVTVKDKAGDARRVQKLPFHLRIPTEKLNEAMSDRAHHVLPIVLQKGDQQVAVGVRDEVAATMSTARLEVTGIL